ncbi:MAG TPA: hypothetical protein VK501_15365 [Baekduia sp.]|uniref:hypothetical protein n=1 Tax=Baekduia sp. TaxID=2600305 RepID=UPI002BE963F5|nr:hypothetical protein [Baekduia sp.]HMJ35288.1 hypothetical protein [Baekduia sp.]
MPNLSDGAAVEALRARLGDVVLAEPWTGDIVGAGGRVADYRDGDHVAVVQAANGRKAVVDSTAPLRARDPRTGLLAPVDLHVRPSGTGFAAVNPIAPITLPERLSDGISVGRFAVRVTAAADVTATALDDASVAWPNAFSDTDVVARPTSSGAQLLWALRSDAAPEDFPVAVEQPARGRLELVTGVGGAGAAADGSVRVLDATGAVVGTVGAPYAWDAENTPFRTAWRLDGGRLSLHVAHAGIPVAWPITVDPIINDQRYYQDLSIRHWNYYSPQPSHYWQVYGNGGWGEGMYQGISTYQAGQAPFYYPDGEYAYWYFSLAGRTARILQIHAENMDHDSGANVAGGPATCSWVAVFAQPPTPGAPYDEGGSSFRCDSYRSWVTNVGNWTTTPGTPGNAATYGISMYGGGARGYFQQHVGVLVLALRDDDVPAMSLSAPTGWTNNTGAAISASGSDPGLGLQAVTIAAPAVPSWSGARTVGNYCESNTLCSTSTVYASTTISNLPDGVWAITASGTDPAGNGPSPGLPTADVKVDRTGPAITLSGAAWNARNTGVDAGSYGLSVTATDGNAGARSTAQSGARSITIKVDGTTVDGSGNQPCAAAMGSCSLSRSWVFQPGLYGYGPHTISVTAADQLGNSSTTSFSITADCCFATALSWGAALPAGDIRYADVNGDDLDDAVVRNTSTGAITVQLAGPAGPGAPSSWGTWATTRDFHLYDIDGNNRDDLVGRDSAGNVFLSKSTGSTFAAATTLTTMAPSLATLRFGDVNGDQLGDVVGENPSTGVIQIVLTNGTLALQRIDSALTWTPGDTFILNDVDGDGTDDAVGRNIAAGTVKVGFSVAADFETRNGPWNIAANADFAVGDVNADGLADLIYRASGSSQVLVRTATQDDASTTFDAGQVWADWPQTRAVTTADATGDGAEDVVARDTGSNALYVAVSHGRTPPGASTANDPVPAPSATPQALAALPLECQNASTMKVAMMDDGRLLYHQNEGPDAPLGIQHTVERIAALGTEVVRLTVYWGAHENKAGVTPRYFWDKLDTAVDTITSTHVGNNPACGTLGVHLTLTGQTGRQCPNPSNPSDPANYDGNARDCDSTVAPTGLNPDSARFAAFVRAAVNHFETRPPDKGKPASYSLWNEPNLPSHQFLSVTGTAPSGQPRQLLTAARYRSLYVAGYRAAQLGYCEAHQVPTTCTDPLSDAVRVFIGELSEQRTNDSPTGAGSPRPGGYSALDYLYEVLRPTSTTSAPIVALGLALHAYQHIGPPDHRGPSGQVGIGKLRAPLTAAVNGNRNRVGVLEALTDLRDRRGPNGNDTSGAFWLRTPGGAKAPLFITEFGYLNLPVGAKASGGSKANRTKWKTEATRAKYFTDKGGVHAGAIYQAQVADARWLTIHTLSESGWSADPSTNVPYPPVGTHPDFRAQFDTGLVAPVWASDWSDAIGVRAYGKTSVPGYTDGAQQRSAYCELYKELKGKHFPAQQAGVPCP